MVKLLNVIVQHSRCFFMRILLFQERDGNCWDSNSRRLMLGRNSCSIMNQIKRMCLDECEHSYTDRRTHAHTLTDTHTHLAVSCRVCVCVCVRVCVCVCVCVCVWAVQWSLWMRSPLEERSSPPGLSMNQTPQSSTEQTCSPLCRWDAEYCTNKASRYH